MNIRFFKRGSVVYLRKGKNIGLLGVIYDIINEKKVVVYLLNKKIINMRIESLFVSKYCIILPPTYSKSSVFFKLIDSKIKNIRKTISI
mmetsp:Transcript_32051/g.44695  ORF Transcript_32051/g.44695 Transcript_32051/m.44695 type:complete len:89 (+) Transcript_32051:2630-2896(+)